MNGDLPDRPIPGTTSSGRRTTCTRPTRTRRASHARTTRASFVITVIMSVASSVLNTGCGPWFSGRAVDAEGSATNATIEEVVDGDTIVVESRGDRERVRMIGIDTPETVHPTKPVECFGPEASAHTKEALPKGTPVLLVRDVEARDRYGRLLAYVYRTSDGLFVNLDLVLRGYATSYKFPPNDTLYTQFARAEAIARSSGSGMWSQCPPGPPG